MHTILVSLCSVTIVPCVELAISHCSSFHCEPPFPSPPSLLPPIPALPPFLPHAAWGSASWRLQLPHAPTQPALEVCNIVFRWLELAINNPPAAKASTGSESNNPSPRALTLQSNPHSVQPPMQSAMPLHLPPSPTITACFCSCSFPPLAACLLHTRLQGPSSSSRCLEVIGSPLLHGLAVCKPTASSRAVTPLPSRLH